MNYFHMSFDEILDSPFQRLIMLAVSVPKYKRDKDEDKSKKNPDSQLSVSQFFGMRGVTKDRPIKGGRI